MTPLFIPFALFILNGAYVHSFTVDNPKTFEECMHDVADATKKASSSLPPGGKIVGGCLPLPAGVRAPQSKEPLDKKSLDPESHSGTI